MDINLSETISILEVIWGVLAGIGFIVHTVNAMAANGDLRRLSQSKTNSVRLIIAMDSRRTEVVLLVTQVAYAIAATLAMLRPPPLRTLGFPASAPLYLFLISQVILVWSSHIRRLTRQNVIAALKERSK